MKRFDETSSIDAKGVCKLDEFRNVQAPFPPLQLRHEALGLLKLCRDLDLSQSSIQSGLNEQAPKNCIFRTVKGIGHP